MTSFDDGDGLKNRPSAESAREHARQWFDRFPASYKRATWRCVIPGQHTPDDVGIGFNAGEDVIRLRLSRECGLKLMGSLRNTLGGDYAIRSNLLPAFKEVDRLELELSREVCRRGLERLAFMGVIFLLGATVWWLL